MKHLFIINPAAGKKDSTERLLERIRALKLDTAITMTAQAGTPGVWPSGPSGKAAAHRCAFTPAAGTVPSTR